MPIRTLSKVCAWASARSARTSAQFQTQIYTNHTHESHALSMPLYFKRSYLKIQLNSELSIFLFLPSNPNPIPSHPIHLSYIRIYLFCVFFLFIRNLVFLVIHLLRISYASTKNTNSYLISREHLGLDNTILMTWLWTLLTPFQSSLLFISECSARTMCS